MSKKTQALIIVIVIYLCTAVGAAYFHVKDVHKNSTKGITIECIEKKNGLDSDYNGNPITQIVFEIKNNGEYRLSSVKGTVTINSIDENINLLDRECKTGTFFFLDPGESTTFYITLYDIKNSKQGVETFNDIYASDFSDLDIEFKMESAEWSGLPGYEIYASLLFIPTGFLALFLYAFICFKLYNWINMIDNLFLRFFVILITIPFYFYGLMIDFLLFRRFNRFN